MIKQNTEDFMIQNDEFDCYGHGDCKNCPLWMDTCDGNDEAKEEKK